MKRGGRRAAVAAEVGIAALAAKKVRTNVFYITLILILLQEATPRKGGRGAAPPNKKATPAPKAIKKLAANVVKDVVEDNAEEAKYGLVLLSFRQHISFYENMAMPLTSKTPPSAPSSPPWSLNFKCLFWSKLTLITVHFEPH